MKLIDVVGWIAFLITLIYTSLGLPDQIRKNHKNRSTQGLSLPLYVMLLFTFSIWVVYGSLKSPPDWYIVGSNFPGALCVIIILYQFRIYHRSG